MESQNGSSIRSGSLGTGRPSGRCRGGNRRRFGFRIEPNLQRRHRTAGLDRDAERQEEPVLEVGIGQQQDHRHDLGFAVPGDQVRDLGIGDLGGIHGHLASEVERRPLGFRKLPMVAFKERSPASSRPARFRSASAYAMLYSQRLARAATHRILPRSSGPSGLRVRLDPVQVEHGRRGPRQAPGQRPRPRRQGLPGTGYSRLGQQPPGFIVAQQRDIQCLVPRRRDLRVRLPGTDRHRCQCRRGGNEPEDRGRPKAQDAGGPAWPGLEANGRSRLEIMVENASSG